MWVVGLVVAVLILVVVVRLVRSSPLEFYHESEETRPKKGMGDEEEAAELSRSAQINDAMFLQEIGIR